MGRKGIYILISIMALSSAAFVANALTGGNFDVSIVSQSHGIASHEVVISVRNIQPSNQPFDLRFLINGTSFNIGYLTDLYIHEWKVLPTEVSEQAYRWVERQCWEISNVTLVNESWDCSYNESYEVAATKNLVQWKPSKMALITQGGSVSSDYGSVNIPKAGSKCSYDDNNVSYDCDGTKLFKVTWRTPFSKNLWGWGSYGYFSIYDSLTGIGYDPWWNASFGARVPITVTNDDNKTHIMEVVNFTISSSGAHAITSCANEIAIMNASNEVAYDLKHFEVAEDAPPKCVYRVLANVSAGFDDILFYAYYNDSDASAQSLGPIQLFSDNFDDNATASVWTDTTRSYEDKGYRQLQNNDGARLTTNNNASWSVKTNGGITVFFRANSSSATYTGVWMALIETGTYGTTNSSGMTDGAGTGGVMDYQTYAPAKQADMVGFTHTAYKWNYYVVQTNISTTASQAQLFARSWGEDHDEVTGNGTPMAWVSWGDTRIHNQGNNAIAGWYDFVEVYRGIVNFYKTASASTTGVEEIPEPPNDAPKYYTNETSGSAVYGVISVHNHSVMWEDEYAANGYNFSYMATNATGSWRNYTALRVGNASYFTLIPPAGSYCWNFYANDTYNYWNKTQVVCKAVAKDAGNVSLTLSQSGNFTYGSSETAACYNKRTDASGTAKLYRNGTDVTASENGTATYLGVGIYNFTCNASATQNFTANTTSSVINITKASPSLSINVTPSSSVTYPTKTNATGVGCSSQLSCKLYRNGTEVANPDSDFLDEGTHVYIYNTSGNANYTSGTATASVVVSEAAAAGAGSTYEEGIMIGAAAGAFLFLWMAAGFDDPKWRAIQALFMFIGIFLIANMFALANTIAETNDASADTMTMLGTLVTVSAYAIWISLAYFVIMVAVTALQWLAGRKAKTDV